MPFDLVRRSLVVQLPIVLLCERHRKRLRQRSVEWLSPLALGTHVCSPKMEDKPQLRFTCFSPGHVEKAATPFSRPTQYVHTGATAYIDEQSTLDEAVTRWRPLRESHNGFSCFGPQQMSVLNCVLTNTFAEVFAGSLSGNSQWHSYS